MKTILSIIILNYNTKQITLESVNSIEKNYPAQTQSGEYELILVDNASPDDSLTAFKEYKKHTKIKHFIIHPNDQNLGFSKGNNSALSLAKGEFILFLNPDTIVHKKTLEIVLDFLKTHPDAGAATCKILNADGTLDQNCLRGFPTLWNSFCYFSGLSKIFPEVPFFSGYLQSSWRDTNKIQQVEAIEGAFIMLARTVGERIKWFDEDYFFYGEDLQMCYDIRQMGKKIYYLPQVTITHHGGVSSGLKKQSKHITTADKKSEQLLQAHRFNAMKIFYNKNYAPKNPAILNFFILMIIDIIHKKTYRQNHI